MAKKQLNTLSTESIAAIREVVRLAKDIGLNANVREDGIDDPHMAPEEYLVLVPGGGIAARSGTTVSSAECTVYQRVGATIESTGRPLTVYNFAAAAIPASAYAIVSRDKFGTWWVVAVDC